MEYRSQLKAALTLAIQEKCEFALYRVEALLVWPNTSDTTPVPTLNTSIKYVTWYLIATDDVETVACKFDCQHK